MGNTTEKKSSGRPSSSKKADAVEMTDELVAEVKEPKKKIIPKEIDSSQYVTVRNGFHGKLVYKSRKTNETYRWESFGDEQEMELRELRNAKSSAKKVFINNWFMFDEDWIIDYLGVGQYYKHAVSIDEFEDIFKQSPDELRELINEMSPGQKRSLAYHVRDMISQGKIDSLSIISVLEEGLGLELIER